MGKDNTDSLKRSDSLAEAVDSFSTRILAWYDHYGRKELPWQRPSNLYRVWISEIMLQQTQVATVIPFFERFIERFPDVLALAQASLDEVMHHWSGLGYYARGRNLHKAACIIRDRYDGKFPTDFERVQGLPGIGRSTAGAILALALDRRHPILDGNVKRVLARHRLIEGWPGSPSIESKLRKLAESLTPDYAISEYTQAMMDLGATICRRRQPQCESCPVHRDCGALQDRRQHELPHSKPKKQLPVRHTMMIMAVNAAGELLLERRPPSGIWGGLFSFPEVDDMKAAEHWLEQRVGCRVISLDPWPEISHTFSHFHLRITPLKVKLVNHPTRVMEGDTVTWWDIDSKRVGVSAPVRKLIERIQGSAAE